MSGQRQPISLIQAKGKKHLTKAEIAERQRTEVKAPADKVTAPSYLTPTQKKAFRKTVKELRAIDLISNRLIVPKAPEAPKGNKFDKFA